MNRSKLVLGGMVLLVSSIVFAVHYDQEQNRSVMRAGVLRDKERMRAKREQALASEVKVNVKVIVSSEKGR